MRVVSKGGSREQPELERHCHVFAASKFLLRRESVVFIAALAASPGRLCFRNQNIMACMLGGF